MVFICPIIRTLKTTSAPLDGLHTNLTNSINNSEKLITLITVWGPTESLHVTTLGIYSFLRGTGSLLNREDQWRVMEAARAENGAKMSKVTQQVVGSQVQCVICCSSLVPLPLFTPWKYLWGLLNTVGPLNHMMEQRQDQWHSGKPGPVSWKATSSRTAPLANVFPEEVQAWCWLGNIWTSNTLWATTSNKHPFSLQPHVLPRRKYCNSSNLSPIVWEGTGPRTPGCQACFQLELPSYPDQVTRSPSSAVWYQRPIHTGGLQPEWGLWLGWKNYRREPAHRHRAVWLLELQVIPSALLLLKTWRVWVSITHPGQAVQSMAHSRGRQIDHLFNLSTLSTDSKTNS